MRVVVEAIADPHVDVNRTIGFQLAAAMLKLFDPTLEPVTEPPADLDRLIPMYKGAKIKGV
jgi:hypothetical protein